MLHSPLSVLIVRGKIRRNKRILQYFLKMILYTEFKSKFFEYKEKRPIKESIFRLIV